MKKPENQSWPAPPPSHQEVIAAIRTLIRYIGDDPDRPGLIKTPERVLNAWRKEWGAGYSTTYVAEQMQSIINGQFDDGAENYNQMIAVQKIRFTSHCEHHLAEFSGNVSIAYIPERKILGLSKLVRVVNMFSKKLQVQERLTNNIADFIQEYCHPIGIGVVVKARHSCMMSRGVNQSETEATTSALRGEMLTKPEVRDEFLRLVGR
jgi:GTP cyclohydrolase I